MDKSLNKKRTKIEVNSRNKREVGYLQKDWWEETTIKNLIKKQIKIAESSNLIFKQDIAEKLANDKDLQLVEDKQQEKNKYGRTKEQMLISQIFKYKIQPLNEKESKFKGKIYYSLFEIMLIFKIKYAIDFECFEFNESVKDKFIEIFNKFLEHHSICIDKIILVEQENVIRLLEIFIEHINFPGLQKSIEIFKEVEEFLNEKQIKEKFEYLKKNAFASNVPLVPEEVQKKRNNQYTKLNVPPKWINYAWDILGTIKNSRKSFIFSRYNEDLLEKNKQPKLGIESIEQKLKEKCYSAFDEFERDIIDLFEMTESYWKQTKHPEHSLLCANIKKRIGTQIEKLKLENKIK